MRIGIDATFLRKPGTGIGQVTLHFLEKLKERSGMQDWEFFLYTEEPIDLQLPDNFQIRSFLPWWKRDDILRKWLWERQLMHQVTRDRIDVFLSLYQSTTVFPASVRHVMVVHDIIPRIFPLYQGNLRQKWYWRGVERAMKHTENIIAVSEATKRDVVAFGIPHERVTVAYPDVAPLFRQGLAAQESARVLERYALTSGYIYHGGGLEIRKNTERLLRAYALLVEKEMNGTLSGALPSLVISGTVFPESNRLATPIKKLLGELDLETRVHLLGFVPEQDLPALYQNGLFFVYPSLYEGFGLPVLEALCMKTPVLTSDNSSLPEVAGTAALLIDVTNVEALAAGMERLMKDVTLRETLRENASREVTRFSWDRFVEQVLAVLVKK